MELTAKIEIIYTYLESLIFSINYSIQGVIVIMISLKLVNRSLSFFTLLTILFNQRI